MMTLPATESRIRRELLAIEETVNIALAQAAALTQTCALARNLPDVPSTSGQPIMLRLSSLNAHLTQGAGAIARVHGELRTLAVETGMLVPDDNGNCPPQTALAAVRHHAA